MDSITTFDRILFLFIFSLISIQILTIIIYYLILKKKYKLLFLTVIILTTISQVILFYGSFIEPKWIEIHEEEINLNANDTISEIKIVFVADYHLGPYLKENFVEKTVEMINSQNPDIVLIGGDFIYNDPDQIKYAEALKDINAKYGIYTILGNHDYGLSTTFQTLDNLDTARSKSEIIETELENLGIEVLRNEKVSISIDSGQEEIILLGLEDLWSKEDDLNSLIEGISEKDNVLLMSHNPDIILDEKSNIADLILSGHTHGGQIRLPFWGSVPPIPSKLGKDYDFGLFELESGNQLFITKGLGEMGPRARLFCRPEILVLNVSFEAK